MAYALFDEFDLKKIGIFEKNKISASLQLDRIFERKFRISHLFYKFNSAPKN